MTRRSYRAHAVFATPNGGSGCASFTVQAETMDEALDIAGARIRRRATYAGKLDLSVTEQVSPTLGKGNT